MKERIYVLGEAARDPKLARVQLASFQLGQKGARKKRVWTGSGAGRRMGGRFPSPMSAPISC